MDDYDNNLWDTDFDSDGDIDADDEAFGDLLFLHTMREQTNRSHKQVHFETQSLEPGVLAIGLVAMVMILLWIACTAT